MVAEKISKIKDSNSSPDKGDRQKLVEEIKKSNSQRIKRVPEYVIDRMYNDFQKDSIYPHRLLNPFDEFTLETKFLIDENVKLFIVGDIHGLYEDMENLLDKEGFFIENDCIFNKDPNKKLLFVGDIIDRGYDSLKILEIIKNSVENQDHYLILGNHEQKLINSYNKFINNEDTYLFGSSEAVTRTFNEFIKLSKDKQKEYIGFLEKLPHYYVYKNNNKIGINNDTKKIVDMIIVDDTYNHNDKLKTGMTSYKIEQVFGKADRQMFEGNTCYIYKNEAKEKLIIQVEPTDKYLESFRITNLPVELPIDTTEYLPDDATDETENPLMADKQIDTSAVSTPAKDKFQINYNYSFTK